MQSTWNNLDTGAGPSAWFTGSVYVAQRRAALRR